MYKKQIIHFSGFLPPYASVRCAPSPPIALSAFSSLSKKEKIRQKFQKNKIRENDLSFSYSSTTSGDPNVSSLFQSLPLVSSSDWLILRDPIKQRSYTTDTFVHTLCRLLVSLLVYSWITKGVIQTLKHVPVTLVPLWGLGTK
jgi:hypothetical protein